MSQELAKQNELLGAMDIIINSEDCSLEEKCLSLEKVLIKEDQIGCPVIHRFGPGIYIREVFVPGGSFVVGHRHKTEHLNIVLTGKMSMLQEDGSIKDIIAPTILVFKPGRKCGYVHQDLTWLNIHSTTETDVEKLELTFLDKTPLIEEETQHINRAIDNEDYKNVLKEFGLTEEVARAQSENEEDQIPFPYGGYKTQVKDSDIEGKGVFASADIIPGESIAPARLNSKRTPAGRYTNHSISPNAKMVMINNDIFLVATKDIRGYKGGFIGEEITTDYRTTLSLRLEV